MISVLEAVLHSERRKGAKAPLVEEWTVLAGSGPYLVSGTRGQFLRSPGAGGVVRFAFFPCPEDQEGPVLQALYREVVQGPGRVATVREALARLGEEAAHMVVSRQVFDKVSDEEVSRRMTLYGCVGTVGKTRVVAGDLPLGAALVMVDPVKAGVYCRVSGSLGVFVQGVGQTILAVPCPTSIPLSATPTPSSTIAPETTSTDEVSPTSKSTAPGSGFSGGTSRPFRSWTPKSF